MERQTRQGTSGWAGYGYALLAVAVATMARLAMDPWVGEAGIPYVTFNAAVAVVAFQWGRNPGFAATLVGAMVCDFIVIPPRYGLPFLSAQERIPMAVFVATGLVVSILAGRLRTSRALAEAQSTSLRERAEELQRERSLQEAIASSTDVMLVYLDREFNFLWVNEAYAQTCKFRPEEMVGKNHFALYPHAENEAIFRSVRDTGVGVFKKDKAFEFPDQPERGVTYWDWSLSPVKDGAGTVTGMVFSLRETTAYVSAQKRLEESEGRLRLFVEHAPAAVAILDKQMRYVAASRRWRTDYGIAERDIVGHSHYEIFPEIPQRWRDIHQRCLNGAVEKCDEDTFVRTDGHVEWVRWEIHPWRTGDGDIGGIALFTEVITERKEAAERSHLQLMVLQSAANAIVITATDGTIEWVNAAFTRLTGFSEAEVVGKNPRVLNSGQQDDAFFERMWDTITTGRVWHGELVNRRKDGVLYPEEMTVTPVKNDAGQITHYIAIKQDISERKRVEEALRDAAQRLKSHLENSPVAVIEFDPNMRITRWTEAAQRIFGWAAEEVMGKTMWDVPWICDEDRDKVVTISTRLLEGRDSRNVSPNRNVRKDGSLVWCEWYNSSLHDEQGELDSILSVVLDVTERVKAQEAVQHARQAAESASKAKDHFLAVLSHELRNPLNPVLAAASMLWADPRFDVDTREQLAIICRNAELEVRLIDDMLDVTRIERGKVELDRRPTDLSTVLQRAVEVCMPTIKSRGLEFGIDAPDGPYWVDADAARLQQVFWNLLRNSTKFTPAGGCVGIKCRRESGGFVVAEVTDSGEGIEPEALQRIFNAFEQGERSITRQFGGLGLGLTISKALVELHGGTIAGHSEGRGKGATFTVRLPLIGVKAAAVLPPQSPQTVASSGSLRILLVEDHVDTARVMRRLLQADGHAVETAGEIATGLRLAGEKPFDLLLSDLGLPDGSGLDLMRQLRAMGSHIPGIALSGYGQEKDIQQSREAGFEVHLVKPVNLLRLKEEIARIVAARAPRSKGP